MQHTVKHHGTRLDSDLLTFTELVHVHVHVRAKSDPGAMGVLLIPVGIESRRAFTAVGDSGGLLVLLDPGQIVSRRMRQRASEASPDHLIPSLSVSSVRAKAVAKLADHHCRGGLAAIRAAIDNLGRPGRAANRNATHRSRARATAYVVRPRPHLQRRTGESGVRATSRRTTAAGEVSAHGCAVHRAARRR